ncbi:MAG: response regulator [Bryobacteraceae bacterium]|nr:response regulator [Bryobacteraceae bacterium]
MERTELSLWNANEVARLLALVENEKRYYQEILNVVPSPLAVVSPRMTILSVNRAFRRMFASQAARQLDEVLPKAEVEAVIRAALDRDERQTAELGKVLDRQGMGRAFRASAFPFRDPADEGSRNVLLVLEEIQGAGPVGLVEEMASALWWCEPATGKVWMENELARQWIGEADGLRVAAEMENAAPGDVVEVEYRVERRGEEIWLRDRIRAVSADRLVVETADIGTAKNRSRAEGQSKKAAAISRMAGALAHDFNNLLMVIAGNTEMLLQETPPGERREALEQVLAAAERAAGIGDQLRRVARPPTAKPQLFDLNEFLRRNTVGAKLELSGQPEFVSVDASILSDALRTLAVWAAERVPAGGRLTVRTGRQRQAPDPECVVLTMGPIAGLSAEDTERWMEPFGVGGGYDLAAAFLALQGMTTPAALQSEDGHHVLTIRFPVVAQTRQSSKGTVLVVEDEEAVRSIVTRLLGQSGCEVLEAESGVRALEIARNHPAKVDLLLTDVNLGAMDGLEVARLVREKHPGVRVIYMSGHTDDARLTEGNLKPGETFLAKPFRISALQEKIRHALAG